MFPTTTTGSSSWTHGGLDRAHPGTGEVRICLGSLTHASPLPLSRRCQQGPTPPRREEPTRTAWGVRRLEGTRDGRERRIHLGAQRRDDCHNHRRNQRHHHAVLHRRRPSFVVQVPQDAVVYLRHHRLSPWYRQKPLLCLTRLPLSSPAWRRLLRARLCAALRRFIAGSGRHAHCTVHIKGTHRETPGTSTAAPILPWPNVPTCGGRGMVHTAREPMAQ